MTKPVPISARPGIAPRTALLDAAERLLVAEGYAGATTRRVAEEAGLNHGLIHYYFGSMDELFAQVLERFTDSLIDRQREMYARDVPFLEKWRTAMAYLEQDATSGYQKLWLELQALAWNRPELRERVARVNSSWRDVLTDAFRTASDDYGLDTTTFPVEALVSLVMTFNQGLILERLSGVTEGQDALLDSMERWLTSLDGAKR